MQIQRFTYFIFADTIIFCSSINTDHVGSDNVYITVSHYLYQYTATLQT